MSEREVVLVACGMMTSVGLSSAETAASVRAGTTRVAESVCYDKHSEPFTLAQVPPEALPQLDPQPAGEEGWTARGLRVLTLAIMPLVECAASCRDSGSPPGLAMALPEPLIGAVTDPDAFLAGLAEQTEGLFDLSASTANFSGRAGGVAAMGHAASVIAAGDADFMLAGGSDSYLDLMLLGTLDLEERVASRTSLDGFVPGEGAGFVLLAERRAAEQAGLSPRARLSQVAVGEEAGHFYSEEAYRGEGLANTVANLFAEVEMPGPVTQVYSSMNGENHWAKELGVTLLRHQDQLAPDVDVRHPVECFGDLGAAIGPVMAGLAATDMARGGCGGPTLLYGSSDRGSRAALLLFSC